MKKSPAEEKQGQSVEDIFRNGFAEEGEPAPPARVWENLDRILENQELQQYRRQIGWYRSIAAAALLLLFSGALMLWQKDYFGLSQPAGMPVAVTTEAQESISTETNEAPINEQTHKQAANSLAAISEKEPLNRNSGNRAVQPDKNKLVQKVASHSGKAFKRSDRPVQLSDNDVSSQVQEIGSEEVVAVVAANLAERVQEEGQSGLVADKTPAPDGIAALANAPLPMRQNETILRQKEAQLSSEVKPASIHKADQTSIKEDTKWSIAVAYSPQYAYTPVKLEQRSGKAVMSSFAKPEMAQEYQHAVAEYNNTYSPTYSFTTLVGASYKLNAKWQLESGVLYTQNEATSHHSYLVSDNSSAQRQFPAGSSQEAAKNVPLVANALNTDAAALSVSRAPQYNTKYKYQQLGVPLRIAYTHNIKKFFAYVSGGVNLNLLMENSIEPEVNQIETVRYSFTDKNSPFNVWQWATAASVGVGYEVNKNMRLLLAPEFTYSLTPMVRDEQQHTEAYQVGISIGGRWRLSK